MSPEQEPLILTLIKIFGALGLFIYGMKVMSEGIQKVAGDKLRSGLSKMTDTRFGGVMTGFFTTSVIQSSSATTVMIVSFVNAGLLNLKQAIGVIMGANIGTTVTALIIVLFGFKFSISSFALPLLMVAVPLFLFSKTERWKYLGEFLIGFSILFIGLGALKDLVPNDLPPETQEFIGSLGEYGFFSTVLMVIVGTIVTIVVQSSSAAMAITLTLCSKGIIPFEMAAAIVLGENIGTTVTANIAAVIGNTHAKRAARAHLIFNLMGVLWMLILFNPFLRLIDGIVQSLDLGSPFADVDSINNGLTAFHMLFNILNTLLLVWFVNFIAKVVIRIIPSNDSDDEVFKLNYISGTMVKTPSLSLQEAKMEIRQFGKVLASLSKNAKKLLLSDDRSKSQNYKSRIADLEQTTDKFEEEVSNYVIRITGEELSQKNSNEIRDILSIASEFERTGDEYLRLVKHCERLDNKKYVLNTKQKDKLEALHNLLAEAVEIVSQNLNTDNLSDVSDEAAIKKEEEINKFVIKLHKQNLKSIEAQEYSVKEGIIYKDIIASLETIGDHLLNISQSAVGKYSEEDQI
ncbi:Na/Pi cotransporter family protein [Roseivirga sp.]|uniref:Na/Pi cotransporter family protein n=1 Tax=Roseivirga sp. TaxID=1964215 RepID=UPI003B8AA2FF